jgi:uncharacterized membrane protein
MKWFCNYNYAAYYRNKISLNSKKRRARGNITKLQTCNYSVHGFHNQLYIYGVSWARRLKFCHYLKKLDKGLVRLNHILLFLIMCLPFLAKGLTEHTRPGFLLPVFIYLINITCVIWIHYI